MKPLSEVAPGLLVIQILIQAVCLEHISVAPHSMLRQMLNTMLEDREITFIKKIITFFWSISSIVFLRLKVSQFQNVLLVYSNLKKTTQKISRISALASKGQLISKCPFGIIVWTKIPTKLFLDFCPEIFFTFLGASWKLFGLPGDLWSNIINKEAYRKPKKLSGSPHEATKKFRAEIQK